MLELDVTVILMMLIAVIIIITPILLKYEKLEVIRIISGINLVLMIIVAHQLLQMYGYITELPFLK
jgi:hypothetical protein